MTINIANTELTDSFDFWRLRTNDVTDALTNQIVTVDSNAAVGNAVVTGTIQGDTLIADTISGGAIGALGLLTFDTNTAFTGTKLTISGGFISDSANVFLGLAANVQIVGSNATHSVLKANNANDKLFFDLLTTDDISDFNITSVASGEILFFNTANSEWQNTADWPGNTLLHGTAVDNPSSGVHGVSGDVVGTTDTQTLENKTLTDPIIDTIVNSGNLTLPVGVDTLVARDSTDTLANKTMTSPLLNSPTIGTALIHTGDIDNKIVFGTDTQDIQTGGSSRLDANNSGIRLGGANARVTTILDEDDMTSNSAVALVTQQSAKAYVDDSILGQQTIWVPKNSWRSRATDGPADGSFETSSNFHMIDTFDFDTATDEFIQLKILMPKGWDEGTLLAQVVWSHPATTTNFGTGWSIQAVALADNTALDSAFPNTVIMVDTGGTTDQNYITPESAPFTVGGSPAAEEVVVFQLGRDVSDGGDTLAVDARFEGLKIHYTIDAAIDD